MKKILIVEDDLHIGAMLDELLTKEGYEVSRAYSGTEALLALSCFAPDLVLLDLMLPGLSGEEALAQMRHLPVIVVSAKADVEDKVSLLLHGAADYVTKPFHAKDQEKMVTSTMINNYVKLKLAIGKNRRAAARQRVAASAGGPRLPGHHVKPKHA